jgi:site-specific DNA-methyltransferase (adenine-specific)
VLIPFTGSGSECVVSKKLGIPFIGVEINPEYVKFGRGWLKKFNKNV